MINEVGMFFASYGYYGGAIGDVLNQWEQAGFFSYVLPFLLIFALVFGILSSIQVFRDNKAIEAIIALVVALMALQFDMVPVFFAQVFPRLGVALSVILVILILAGFFIDPTRAWVMYILLGVGAIAAVVVIISAAGETGMTSPILVYAYNNPGLMIGSLIFIVAIAIIVGTANKKPNTPYVLAPWRQ